MTNAQKLRQQAAFNRVLKDIRECGSNGELERWLRGARQAQEAYAEFAAALELELRRRQTA